ncbi:hypothetical protein QP414_08115 [Corynebacterium simulans]|nr:hypothetical protein [Corynebacterium simulans]
MPPLCTCAATVPAPKPARRRSARWGLGLWGTLLVVAVCWSFFLPGEMVWRDMVLLHNPGFTASNFGLGSLPARNAPQDGALALLGGDWFARVLVTASASASAYVAAKWARTSLSAAAAMACAVANPFIVERLLLGHWSLAIAGWLAPVLAWACLHKRAIPAWLSLWASSLTPTGGVFGVLIALVTGRFKLAAGGVALCLPWLVPAITNNAVPGPAAAQVAAFAPRAEAGVGTVGALLGLGGIWSADAVPDSRHHGFALAGLVVAAVALLGARRLAPACRRPLLLLAAVGLGSALISWACPGALAWLIETVPGAGLLRDASKLTLLALPLYVAGIGALPNLPAALALLACLLQAPDTPRELAVLTPRPSGIDHQLVEELDGRLALFPQRPSLVTLSDGTTAVDPYSKAVNKLESGELRVDGVVVDQAQPAYRAALQAWQDQDLDKLAQLGVGAVVVDGRIVAEPPAPAPKVPWALTAAWVASPLACLVLWLLVRPGLLATRRHTSGLR